VEQGNDQKGKKQYITGSDQIETDPHDKGFQDIAGIFHQVSDPGSFINIKEQPETEKDGQRQ
jgi:hypothetical protein